jgi:2-keto-4-pentenoate hydratase
MDVTRRAEAADLLGAAYATGTPIDPLVERYPDMDLDDSYAIQVLQLTRRLEAGARLVGHKVGLTSEAMRRQMGVDQPDFGYLLDGMFHLESLPIPMAGFLQPRMEPEVAFVLGRPLRGPGVTVAEAVRAVDFVLPALEIIDSRIRDWRIGILDTVADNASSGGVVLGGRPVPLDALDLRTSGCLLHCNGELVASGVGAAVLGSPLSSLVWLANTLGARGAGLEAGHVVLPGSITASVRVVAGDTFSATFAGIGSVTACFGPEGS